VIFASDLGDNAIVAQKVCQDVGIPADQYVLGNQIDEMSDDELYIKEAHEAHQGHIFFIIC
jgi:magnesium-transporting ATPase (P-type)